MSYSDPNTIVLAAEMKSSVGWIGYLIIGALAGWIASMIMKTNEQMGFLANIAAGVVGALLGGFLLSFFVDVKSGGWWFTFFTAIVGACIVIGIAKAVMGSRSRS